MYIIVGGGGKVGYYLAKTLINEGHEVLVIEKDKRKCAFIAEELGSVAMRGDACEASSLAEGGANRADVVVAVTGDDEDNLVICQVAKQRFGVPRTIARINNPKNEHIFKLLGIDVTVSHTDLILSQIEQEIPAHPLVHLLKLRHGDLEIIEGTVSERSRALRRPLRDLPLPDDCIISLVVRNGKVIIPTGQVTLEPGDEVIALTKTESEAALRQLLLG